MELQALLAQIQKLQEDLDEQRRLRQKEEEWRLRQKEEEEWRLRQKEWFLQSLGRFVKDGLPPLAPHYKRGSSAQFVDVERAPASVETRAVCALADLVLENTAQASASWASLPLRQAALKWGTERDLEHIVVRGLLDLIALAKLGEDLQVVVNRHLWLAGSPDGTVVVMQGRQTKGVFGIKVPAAKGGPKEGHVAQILDNAHVLGQIHDHMMVVKHYHGVAHVFGVLTTYQDWRFVWLPESDIVAAADSLAALDSSLGLHSSDDRDSGSSSILKESSGKGFSTTASSSESDSGDASFEVDEVEASLVRPTSQAITRSSRSGDDADADAEANAEAEADHSFAEEEHGVRSKDRRVLHASRIYSASESQGELTKLLTSVIYKMHASPVARDKSLRIHVKGGSHFYWDEPPSLSVDDSVAKFNAIEGMPPSAVFVMLRDLGSGADGHAWRATVGNTGCVVKFLLSNQKVTSTTDTAAVAAAAQYWRCLEEEAEVWRKAWPGINVHVRELAGYAALVMPYVRPLTRWTFRRSDVIINATDRAIVELADRGLCHIDLAWRHVGLLAYDEATEAVAVEAKVIFFDLGRVKHNVDSAEAREHMRTLLIEDESGWSKLRMPREEDTDQHAAAQEEREGADPTIAGQQQRPVFPQGDGDVALPDCRLVVRLTKRN